MTYSKPLSGAFSGVEPAVGAAMRASMLATRASKSATRSSRPCGVEAAKAENPKATRTGKWFVIDRVVMILAGVT